MYQTIKQSKLLLTLRRYQVIKVYFRRSKTLIPVADGSTGLLVSYSIYGLHGVGIWCGLSSLALPYQK